MGCPFFAHALHQFQGGHWILAPHPRSNRCALITSAHSPCLMEISGMVIDWDCCPRNPDERLHSQWKKDLQPGMPALIEERGNGDEVK